MKTRFIPQSMQENAGLLLTKMRKETRRTEAGDFWRLKAVRGLEIENRAFFKDGRFLAKRDSNGELKSYGENRSMLEFGKTRLIINNSNGEIIEHKKPFFKSWKNIFKQAEHFILAGLGQYNNESVVKKIILFKEGLTAKGAEHAQKELKPIMDFIERMSKC